MVLGVGVRFLKSGKEPLEPGKRHPAQNLGFPWNSLFSDPWLLKTNSSEEKYKRCIPD